jgi:nucleoside-diphosphate-sugar epimerase
MPVERLTTTACSAIQRCRGSAERRRVEESETSATASRPSTVVGGLHYGRRVRVLVFGGTGLTGVHAVRRLVRLGHETVVFHRGVSEPELPAAVRHVHADVAEVPARAKELRALAPDVILDMLARRLEDAARTMIFRGIAERAVVISSADVYRAFGRIWRTEPGPPDSVPLTEDSPLRERLSRDGLDYDKTGVERELANDGELPVTILRYPAVHGPNDPNHRLFQYVQRMDEGRPAILLDDAIAGWRWVRGYAENVGHATALAVADERAAGRVYNVADPIAYTEAEWVRAIAAVHGWDGEVIAVPRPLLPEALRAEIDTTQDYAVDSGRIRRELGFAEPVAEEVALRRTIEWERANPPTEQKPEDFDYDAEDSVLALLGRADR